jgi:alpha/beta superfamily hydrolase
MADTMKSGRGGRGISVTSGLPEEKPVEFPGLVGILQGRLSNETSRHGGALIAVHPHPLYGGNMDNKVVEAAVRAGQACDLITLRFNLRGVGGSQGSYDEGIGEQDDIGAALDFLGQRFSPQTMSLVGYSFGAYVALAYCHRQNHGVDSLFLISPPPFLLPDDLSLDLPVVKKIVLGENDEIALAEEVKSRIPMKRAEELIQVIPGADHFFWGKEGEIEKLLVTELVALS